MKLPVFLLALPLAALLGSCDKPSTPAADPKPPTKPAAATVAPKPVDYIALGVPAPNREWSPIDYDHALKALANLPMESLPRLEISSGVFERMVAHENLNLIRNTTLPMSQRMPAAMGYSQGINGLLKLYALHPYQTRDLRDETLGLMDLSLSCSALMLPLADEFMTSLPVEEQNNPVRKEGFRRVIGGMEQTFSGGVVCLGEMDIWTEEQRSRLAQVLERTLITAWPSLTDGFKREIPIRLKERFDAATGGPAKEAIGKLRNAISKL